MLCNVGPRPLQVTCTVPCPASKVIPCHCPCAVSSAVDALLLGMGVADRVAPAGEIQQHMERFLQSWQGGMPRVQGGRGACQLTPACLPHVICVFEWDVLTCGLLGEHSKPPILASKRAAAHGCSLPASTVPDCTASTLFSSHIRGF